MVGNDLSYQRISRGYENETVMSAALRAMTLDNTLSLKERYLIMSGLRRLFSRLSEVISASRTRRNIYYIIIRTKTSLTHSANDSSVLTNDLPFAKKYNPCIRSESRCITRADWHGCPCGQSEHVKKYKLTV